MQGKMQKSSKRRAPRSEYISQKQLSIEGFTTPFHEEIDPDNRWVILSKLIPWDDLVSQYLRRNKTKKTGRPSLNPRVAIGAVIIKHLCALDDRETVAQITENICMQYFLGYSSYSNEPPFDPSLFVEIRKRMGDDLIAGMNDKILEYSQVGVKAPENTNNEDGNGKDTSDDENDLSDNKGELLMDATVCPQDIAYPTDINLLNEAREMTDKIIDILHRKAPWKKRPRTYRQIARKDYLHIAQNRNPSKKKIRKGIKQQLQYLRRNFSIINPKLDRWLESPLKPKWQRYYWIIQTLYQQQKQMFDGRTHQVDDRIVSIHQPHVRPMVRGKARHKTEFGSKIHLSMVDGYSFMDTISWDAFNESTRLVEYVENFRKRFGHYPKKVLVDKIYATRENRNWLKQMGIEISAKPLGRPSARAVANHIRPGERNPIEGKFGQAKNGYGMNLIRARLKNTSQSWVASIILVLNLVKLAREALYCLSFSAWRQLLFTIKHAMGLVFSELRKINRPEVVFRPIY